jgi:hypothetical protein
MQLACATWPPGVPTQPGNRASPLWRVACDPTSAAWASEPLVLASDNATCVP